MRTTPHIIHFKFHWKLLAIFISLFFMYWLGCYYENETDIFFVTYAKGLLTAKPLALPETYILQIFLGDLTAYLYSQFPNFEWYDLLTFWVTFLIGAFLFKIYQLLKEDLVDALVLRVAVLFFFVALFISSALIPEITRHSFLIIILSFLIISIKLFRPQKVSRFLLVLCYFIFLLSLLRRTEPATVLTFLFGAYLLLISFEKIISLNRVVKIILPCLLMVGVIYIYTHTPTTPEGDRYLKVVPYENTLVDFKGSFSELTLLSKEDSIKYNAVSHFFFSDTRNLNETFFQRIGIIPLDKSPIYLFNYIGRTSMIKDRWHQLVQDVIDNESWLFLLSIFINLLWMYSGFKYSAKVGAGRTLFTCVFWNTFLFANLFMKVETKVNESLQIFMILLLLVHFIHFDLQRFGKNIVHTLTIALVATVFLKSFLFFQVYEKRKSDALYMDKVRYAINNTSESLVVFNISCWDEISIRIFDNDHYNGTNTYISFDNGILYLYEAYNKYMKQVTGSGKFIDQVNYVARRSDAYWFSSEERMKMLVEYINLVYKTDYKYSLVKKISRDDLREYDTKLIGIYKVTAQ